MSARFVAFLLALALAGPAIVMRAQETPAPEALAAIAVVNGLTFRNIGPFRTAAWVTEVAVPETPVHEHLYTMYAATRSGGLWKTTNAGTTWTNVSDSVGAAAVGAVALAPSNPTVVLSPVRRQVHQCAERARGAGDQLLLEG
jgi:hypothetical protein